MGTPPPPFALATMMDLLLDAVVVVDGEGHYLYVNAGFERILGYRAGEVLGTRMIELVHPDDRERTLAAAKGIMAGTPQLHFRNRYLRRDGGVVDMQWSARWTDDHKARVAVGHDVTALCRAEAAQSALLELSAAAQSDGDLDALYALAHAIVLRLLPGTAFAIALRGRRDALLPAWCADAAGYPREFTAQARRACREAILGGPAHVGAAGTPAPGWLALPLHTADGTLGAMALSLAPTTCDARSPAEDMQLLGFIAAQLSASIERKQTQARLQHMVRHDALTGLANRNAFDAHLADALAASRRDGTRLAVLFVDIDGFKGINDRHGHAVGDAVLVDVAARMRGCVRQTDVVARMGGDEFVVLLRGLEAEAAATAVGESIRAALASPCTVEGRELRVSASIGIALHPQHGQDRQRLLRHADEAMYAAKRRGGNQLGSVPTSPGATPADEDTLPRAVPAA